MMRKPIILLPFLVLSLASCGQVSSSSSSVPEEVEVVETTVYGNTPLPTLEGTLSYTYEGKDIFIDEENNTVSGTKGGSETQLTISNGQESKQVLVKVANREYVSNHQKAEENEGWFQDVKIDSSSKVTSSFANGMDVSSAKQLIDAGQRFYDEEGCEKSLFRILAEHDVNWVRLRLWNDPYNHAYIQHDDPTAYGGGIGDLASTLWMAKQAKYFGLHFLLDFHYSDFWVDPGTQVIPKAWAKIDNATEMAKAISTYTSQTLEAFKEIDTLPDMVQIGNEVTGGMLLQLPGEDKAAYTGGNPGYIEGKTAAPSSIAGTVGSDNFKAYIKAGVDAVKEVDPNILTMVHIAQSFDKVDAIKWHYQELANIDYDVIGFSAYSYYHYSSLSTLQNALTSISQAFPDKKIAIAETAYGFTYESDANASHIFSSSGSACPVDGYPCSIQGQADIIADATKSVASLENGFGCFYWEGAWTPTKYCGWGDRTSKASWANQGLFSYDGKALGSLSLYQKLLGK